MAIWEQLLGLIGGLLRSLHTVVSPLFGEAAGWGWAIIALTILIRVFLLPLAIKQTRSQRAMQKLAPEVKKIQAKYKADRGMMKTDPEKYREVRQKQQQATMALYKEHGVNPAAGCVPLIAQMPIFIALFSVLRSEQFAGDFQRAHFYFVNDLSKGANVLNGLDQVGALLLVGLMGLTTFFSSRQMMASNAAGTPEQAQQQKIMMYVMPLVLLPISWSIPVGVLLYWVTTNVWTIGQQFVIFRSAQAQADAPFVRESGGVAKQKSATTGAVATAANGGKVASSGKAGKPASAGKVGKGARNPTANGAAKSPRSKPTQAKKAAGGSK